MELLPLRLFFRRELYTLRFVHRVGTLCAMSDFLIGGYQRSGFCWESAGASREQESCD